MVPIFKINYQIYLFEEKNLVEKAGWGNLLVFGWKLRVNLGHLKVT